MQTETTALILAAGVGSRLRPLTDDRPKCLVPVGATTILHRALDALSRAGVDRVVISAGYHEERLRAAVRDLHLAIEIVSNPDFATTQNVVSLVRALAVVPRGERVIKFDGDVLFADAILRNLLDTAGTSVAIDRSAVLGVEEMKVRVDDDRIRAFGKGLDPSKAHGESIGIECFASEHVSNIREALERAVRSGRTDVYYEDVYNDVVERVPFRPVFVDPNEWMEVDDVEDLARARARFG